MGTTPLVTFKARVHFLPTNDGGRKVSPNQGYRPMLHFTQDDSYYGSVYLYFMDPSGEELRPGEPIPKDAVAEFRVYHEDVRALLRDRIKPEATFELSEGPRVVAHATIESVGNL